MSTRRARIKAVAVLPVRKRPVENKVTSEEKSSSEVQNSVSKEPEPESLPENDVNKTSECQEKSENTETETTKESSTDDKSNNVSENSSTSNTNTKEPIHRRRTMKPSINISNTTKRNKPAVVKKDTPKSPLKSPSHTKKSESTPRKMTPTHPSPLTEDSVLYTNEKDGFSIDGIVPLNTNNSAENSKAPVHNNPANILSAECNFDPIIPIPSSLKNRPKLKPIPRLAIRRNSCQGSASESEDDVNKNKRDEPIRPISSNTPLTSTAPTTNRIRNDSVCSLPSDPLLPINIPMTPRQKTYKPRPTGGESRKAMAKKRAMNKSPKASLTMCDLIYCKSLNTKKSTSASVKDEKEAILKMEEKYPVERKEENAMQKSVDQSNCVPVPQVKLGPNGELVVDEQSLIIETTGTIKSRNEISKLSVVYETGNISSGGLYRRTTRSKDWSNAETLRFYKALNTIGTDFALMLQLFPGRTRRDLKMKFKKEEKQNMPLVDKALMNPSNFDISELQAESLEEQARQKKLKEEKTKETQSRKRNKPSSYYKSSAALRSMEECIEADHVSPKKPNTRRTKSKSENVQVVTEVPDTMETLPENLEPGSVVVIVKKIPGRPGHNTLQAYASDPEGKETKIMPIGLNLEVLKSIASDMNMLQEGQEYELAPDHSLMEISADSNNDDVLNSDTIEIDETILNDSTIDNYILTGDAPNIIISTP